MTPTLATSRNGDNRFEMITRKKTFRTGIDDPILQNYVAYPLDKTDAPV